MNRNSSCRNCCGDTFLTREMVKMSREKLVWCTSLACIDNADFSVALTRQLFTGDTACPYIQWIFPIGPSFSPMGVRPEQSMREATGVMSFLTVRGRVNFRGHLRSFVPAYPFFQPLSYVLSNIVADAPPNGRGRQNQVGGDPRWQLHFWRGRSPPGILL